MSRSLAPPRSGRDIDASCLFYDLDLAYGDLVPGSPDSGAPTIVVIRPAGRLTLRSASRLRQAVLKCLADQPAAIVIDAARLQLAEDIHLTVFAALARHAAAWPGIPVLISRPADPARSALLRLGLDRHVTVCGDLAEAVRLVAARTPPSRMHLNLLATSGSAAAARRLVTDACRCWSATHLTEVACLVASELVGNAVRHAGTSIDFAVVRSTRYLHLTVRDYNHRPARLTGPDQPEEPGGRGLLLVDNLTTGWGCTPAPDGKVTWATLRLL